MAVIAMNVRLPWTATGERGPLSSNTWHFDSGSETPDETNAAFVADALVSFYGSAMDGIWSPLLTGAIDVSATRTADPTPRLPFGLWSGTLTPETNGIPPENTLNVSVAAARAVGVPSQRNRGTIHLGPLATGAIDAAGRATSAVVDQLHAGLDDLITALGSTVYTWVVGSVAHGFLPLAKITVKNDLGIVRRRNLSATDSQLVTP